MIKKRQAIILKIFVIFVILAFMVCLVIKCNRYDIISDINIALNSVCLIGASDITGGLEPPTNSGNSPAGVWLVVICVICIIFAIITIVRKR